MPVLQLDNLREALAKEEAPCHLDLSKLIQAGTKTFFNNPTLSDLTLVCPDGRALHCHSVILAAASRRLAAALKQGNWTPGQQMPVKGVDSDALETLICAFYTAECPLELGRVPALYDAAVKLEVPSLAPALEQYLSSALQPHNCCQVLEICLNVGVAQLADLTLDWIRSRVADVVPSPEFRSSRLETAACICKDLAQRSQLMGLQAAVSWLSAVGGRASLVAVFAEATGLSVNAIQAVAVSGAALGPMGHGGGGGGGAAGGGSGAAGGLLHLSHGGSHGLGGHAGSLLGPGAGAGPSLNLQQGLGLSGSGEPSLSAGMSLGLGGGGGGGGGVQVLQLMPSAGGGPQAVLVMPQSGGAGAMSGENGPLGPHGHHIGNLQSLLSLHGGGGGGAGKGGGGGGLGGGGLGGGRGPAGFGLDALADAAEGERVQKRMRAAAAGGGAGGFATPAAESGSATSMHSDMSGGAQRMAGLDDSGVPPFHHQHNQQHQRLARGDVNYAALQQQLQQHPTGAQTGTGVHARQQQLLLQQQQAEQQQALRGKPAGGRGAGGRRRRGTSASDDDEDYAPSGGRGGGGGAGGSAAGGSGRSRAQEIVYDADAPMDDPSAAAGTGGNASAGSGPGDDDAGGNTGAGSGASPKVGGAVSGGSGGGAGSAGGGGGVGGNPPVLMTGRRAPAQKGMCHVQGCHRSLVGLRDYYQRYKICEHHLKVSSVLKDGVAHRFCQQCGRFHPLSEFDGDRRSCRTMLQRHCHRRAKQKQELAEVLAQRFEEKQVAASMSAVVAAMARNAQAAGNVAGLSPMLQLQYLAGLPAAAAVAAAALDEEQLGALTAAAVRSGGSSAAGSDGSGASAKTGGAVVPAGGGGGGSRGRGSLPPGLHSPPSKAQLLEAMEQRARTQRVAAQQQKLLGLPTDVPLAAALAAAAAAAGGDLDASGGHDGGNEVGGAAEHNAPAAGGGGGGRSDNDRYAGAMLQGPELGGGASGDDGGAGPLKQEAEGGAAGMGDDAS